MAISINLLSTFSLPAFLAVSPKDASGNSGKNEIENGASITGDVSGILKDKDDAKLEKIKEEIKQLPVLPSSDEIVSEYGITTEQAKQVLAEVCMELAIDVGGTSEQIAKTASNMYLVAEMSDSEIFETFDISKILKKSLEQQETDDEKDLSVKQIADKYDITLQQAQAVIDVIEKDDEHSTSSTTASDLSAEPTYSIRSGPSGTSVVPTNNIGSLVLSTVSYDT